MKPGALWLAVWALGCAPASDGPDPDGLAVELAAAKAELEALRADKAREEERERALALDQAPRAGPPELDLCAPTAAHLKKPTCVHRFDDPAIWKANTYGSKNRWTRYLMPGRDDARLPALFLSAPTWENHILFMQGVFPEKFPGITSHDYYTSVLNDRAREFWAGRVQETGLAPPEPQYSFTVEAPPEDPPTAAEVTAVWRMVQPRFGLGELAFAPTQTQTRASKKWGPLPFRLVGDSPAVAYEPYQGGEAYGILRRMPVEGFGDGSGALLSYQDLLVFDLAPVDVVQPVSAVVTGGRQGELSHLAVRSAARGTPTCYASDAWARADALEGRPVHLTCGPEGLTLEASDPAAVLAWQTSRRPPPVDLPDPDLAWEALSDLTATPTTTAAERATSLRRYGAKARNLAALYQRIPESRSLPGFAIPFAAWHQLRTTTQATLDIGDGPREATLGDHLTAIHADERFRTDPAFRRRALAALREAIEAAAVPEAWLTTVRQALAARFAPTTMVRFRSSSNAEDSVEFPGAGLYDSTSVCLADDQDGDDAGPSRCDPDTAKERGVARGLRKVWASLFTDRAVEERLWYGIPVEDVAMGVLVDPRAKDELANVVVFTGAPHGGPEGYLVNARRGEAEVVSLDPGQWPDRVRLRVGDRGEVAIDRVAPGSDGGWALSDERLRELGAAMRHVALVFPLDQAAPEGGTLLLDTEWKVLADGRLVIKQVRPFLRRSSPPGAAPVGRP